MTKSLPSVLMTAGLAILLVFCGGPEATAAEGEAATARVEKTLHTMIQALLANDYAAFLAPGSKDLANRISAHRFAILREDAGPALKNGYTASYELEVPEPDGPISYHWTITPRKGNGELRAIISLKAGKVSNFLLQ